MNDPENVHNLDMQVGTPRDLNHSCPYCGAGVGRYCINLITQEKYYEDSLTHEFMVHEARIEGS